MRGVAVLTITGVLSQLVGFVYRIGLTRLAGAEILGLYQLSCRCIRCCCP